MFLSFGKKRRIVRKNRKPPASLLRKCKKHHIKTTIKRGKKRVYKKVSILKKELRRKIAKARKTHKTGRKGSRKSRKVVRRRFHFGSAAPFVNPSNYGYNQAVPQAAGTLAQSSQVIPNAIANENRPPGFGVSSSAIPTFGVYRPFFTENVPTTVGPSWNFMGQPDGTSYPVGGPFAGYTSFGMGPKKGHNKKPKALKKGSKKRVQKRKGSKM